MKWKILTYLTLVGIVSGVLFSCYKSKNFSTNLTAQIDTAIVVQSYDQARVVSVLDEVFNDVNTALTNQSAVTGAGMARTGRYGVTVTGGPVDTLATPNLCGVQVLMDTTDVPNYIAINYNGSSCDNSRHLYGNVSIYFNPGTSWSAAGDTLGVNINNLSVHDGLSDTNNIQLNGTFYYVNVSGGSLSGLTSGTSTTPVVQQIVSNYLGIVFNENDITDTATWLIARQRTYSTNGGLVITTTGMDSVGGIANVSEWGGNRYGNSFITSITTPLVATAGCNYQVTAGQVQLTNPTGVTILNFGLNSSGSATGCPATGGYYYFQFSWSGTGGNPYSSIRPYPYW
jgi:hypothetical protein